MSAHQTPPWRDEPRSPAPERTPPEGATAVVGAAALAESPTAALVESATQIVADTAGRGQARTVLPSVLFDVPVAILLIDLDDRTVTYANRAAVAMAANQPLPVALDEWGARAGLTDLSGEPLATSGNPLSRLATGHPVAGEAVRAGDRFLWVSGFPLSEGAATEQLALVVLLEVATPPGQAVDPDTAMALLRDRAIIATDLSFTITDPTAPDNPLIWVNPAFTRVTGYALDEIRGHNCRFLQGPDTDPAAVAVLREAVVDRRATSVTLLNYRKDGTAFWNQVSVSPVFDGHDRLVSFVGVQADVTERVRAEDERERAYAAEREARRETEAARHRLGLLAEATTQLAATLDVDETLDRLTDLVVPALADWVVVTLVDGQGSIERTVSKHRGGHERLLARYNELLRGTITDASGTRRILQGADPILVADAAAGTWRGFVRSPEMEEVIDDLGLGSIMYVPLLARRRRILGAVTFVAAPGGRRFGEEDLAVAADLGRRAGLTFDNARLYEHEHRVAETLQRSLLPDVPEIDGLQIAARYLPSDADADVGGDFYEVLPLPDGSIGVAAGDVVGHDLSAAAAMGHLRGLLRACAWNNAEDGRGDPVEVLDRVDRLVQGLDVVPLATLLYGRLTRPAVAAGAWRFAYANAGHPPAMLRSPDGSVRILDDVQGVLLGISEHTGRRSSTVEVAPGSVLVVFTDGLVERRDDSLDHGLARVAAVLQDNGEDPSVLVDRLVATAGTDRQDDTAVMAIRVPLTPAGVPD